MTRNILAAGDNFVLSSLLAEALRAELRKPATITELTTPFPDTPFRDVAEVHEASGTEEDMIEALAGAEVCVAHTAPITEKVLANSPHLKLVAISRGGPVNVNLDAATDHGVAVCYAPGRNATATAEYAIGLILAACRRIAAGHAELATGIWRGDYYRYDASGPELEGATVGLVGYGAIGSRVARILDAFGAHVLVHDPYADPAALGNAERVELAELLRRSRVVSLHARATPDTRGMIGAAEIALMPAGSVLVNCARGSLLDYGAVCDALDSGHLFAAGFDVYDEEPPPPDSRLYRTPGAVLTPHLAGCSSQVAEKAARIVAAEAGRYERGEPLANCANPAVSRG